MIQNIAKWDETIAHSGGWAIALIVIVLVSWVFYRYFAPQNWREWAGAGVVQAFVIALYAEMFGFPLTIYLLIRYFGLDREYVSANLWSTLVGVGETGMIISMALGYGLAFVGIGVFIQGWRQVHQARQEDQLVTEGQARQEDQLVTEGLYSVVRHPQYTGLFIALFGEGIVHWPTIFSVGLFPIIVLTFAWLARKEEREMDTQFGDRYRTYKQEVPMFVPRGGQWRRLLNESRSGPNQ